MRPKPPEISARSCHYVPIPFGRFADSRYEDPAMNDFLDFMRDESGATAIEYALIAGGIALVIIAAVNQVGTTLKTTFEQLDTIWP